MTTFFRAAIMLGVLVGLPAAWMYYGPLPPGAQRVVDRFIASAKEAVDWDARFGGTKEPKTLADATRRGGGVEANLGEGLRPEPGVGTPRLAEAEGPLSLEERLEPLLAQLRDLGAVAYSLEPWGGEQKLFRFCCEMPLTPGGAAATQFEAVGADPESPIKQVVADVTQWNAGRVTMASR